MGYGGVEGLPILQLGTWLESCLRVVWVRRVMVISEALGSNCVDLRSIYVGGLWIVTATYRQRHGEGDRERREVCGLRDRLW